MVLIDGKQSSLTGFHGEGGFALDLGNLLKRKEDLLTDPGSYGANPKYTGQMLFPYQRNFSIPLSEAFTWDAKLSAHATLPHAFEVQVTGIYDAPMIIPQGTQLVRTSLDIGIRQEIEGEGFSAVYETQVIRVRYTHTF